MKMDCDVMEEAREFYDWQTEQYVFFGKPILRANIGDEEIWEEDHKVSFGGKEGSDK